MVGPIEVEQVVHQFSHETGLITEIKPSAVVFGNEISGWPVLTGMSLFAMAVRDIEERSQGIRAETGGPQTVLGAVSENLLQLGNTLLSPGGARGVAQSVLGKDSKIPLTEARLFDQSTVSFESFMAKKYGRTFGSAGAQLASVAESTGIDGLSNEASVKALQTLRDFVTTSAVGGGGVVGAAIGIGGTFAASKQWPALGSQLFAGGKIFTKRGLLAVGGAAFIGGVAGSAVTERVIVENTSNFPNLAWLMGGPVLFLQCLRNDAIIVVPLMKNGHPVIAGLAYNSPNMLWNNFRGELGKWLEDSISGTRDMISLYQTYGSELWRRSGDINLNSLLADKDFVDLTGTQRR
jgi:hypothetical protein